MTNESEEFGIIAKTDRQEEYPCGHTGPVEWDFVFFGRTYPTNVDMVRASGKCAACLLAEVSPLLTSCAQCGIAIGPGEDCILYDNQVCCLSTKCGPGPVAAMPGKWDGQKFVDGVTAGTITSL